MDIDVYSEPKRAIAGSKYGLDDICETMIAQEKISPGDPVFGMKGERGMGYAAHINAAALTAAADLVAGNSVAVVVNGITIPAVDFINSSEETIKAIVQAIDLNDDVRALGIDAYIVDGNPRAFFLSGPGITINASATVTGGASQTTFTQSAYTDAKFMGVARHTELSYREGTGYYPAGESLNVMTHGKIYVPVTDDATPVDKEPAYIVLTGANAGKFTDVVTDNYDCGCVFCSDAQDGLALIEVRGMK
jgi:hypothetical protein